MTDDIANAFGILKQANQTSALFSDALDILQSHFGIVRADLARFFHAIAEAEAEAESSNDEDMIGEGGAGAGADVRVMAQLLERSLAWQRAWVGPLRAFNE